MSDKPVPPSREERLAAKLRENLRRRTAQARAQGGEAERPSRSRGAEGVAPPQRPGVGE